MNDIEFEVMNKYRFSRILDKEDRYVVRGLESIGWMRTGYDDGLINKELREMEPDADIVTKETAGLTSFGREFYYWERVRRNPIRRFWCNFIHSV